MKIISIGYRLLSTVFHTCKLLDSEEFKDDIKAWKLIQLLSHTDVISGADHWNYQRMLIYRLMKELESKKNLAFQVL